MSLDNRVIWSEGTFLQPQHLQQQDRYLESYIELRTRALRPYAWGFLELTIDESLLELGKLAVRSARGVLPDGTPFDCPARDPLPPPLDVPATLRDSLVTLALPVRRPGVDEADLGTSPSDSLARYTAGELEVKDSNASFDRTALIQIGRLRLQVLKESDVSAAYVGLGVARVVERQADNRVALDRRYVPPMLDAGADTSLSSIVRDVHGLLHQRGDALAARQTQPGSVGTAELAEFLWIKTINRYEPLFAHLAVTVPLHPERLYAVCLELAGELSTYTQESRRPVPYPVYRHDDLAGSFGPVVADIRRSLSMVLERNAIPIDLEERAFGVRVAFIPDGDLRKTARFVLAAKAQLPTERLQAGLLTLVKIGPGERIRDLVNLNLPGIALRTLPVAPRQIPYHAGFLYFELDRSGDLWKQTEQSGTLAMAIAGEFPGLELEFWAVRG
ncbi:MAG TPA: type VI secretion system baseplate subunit TssK [Candidatus Methylomirabilis sp.]|nr:type VI secretion system baseplate subunit TssK [Candidatus Methylomirabilis sp.]